MSDWRNCICQNVGSERINDLNEYISTQPADDKSPIDQFYTEIQNIIALFPIGSWDDNLWTGSLASIAIVSSVENYFRKVFSKIIRICTDSQRRSADNPINLGSVIWHPTNEMERGAFENISLASADVIKKTAKKFIGVDFDNKGLGSILSEFDKICELRHGIVHSGREIAGKNGIKLNLQSTDLVTKVNIGFDQFQEVMSICNALVVAANKVLFELLCTRWATSWRSSPSWDTSKGNLKFKNIWSIFYSKIDSDTGLVPENLTMRTCRNRVVSEFDLI